MTAVQVRTFTAPRALGESLAVESSDAAPRTNGVNGTEHTNGVNGTNGTSETNGYPDPPDTPRPRVAQPSNGKMASEDGITYASQDSLPILPIPDLEQTAERYLKALKPLQSPREQSDTRYAVNDFLKNEGNELQDRLKKYAQGKTSYIEQFCECLDGVGSLGCRH